MSGAHLSAFGEAALICPPAELWVEIGPRSVLIRIAGSQLAERLFAPMLHIRMDEPPSKDPDITVLAWSAAETGVALPRGLPLEWLDPEQAVLVSGFPGAEKLDRAVYRPAIPACVGV